MSHVARCRLKSLGQEPRRVGWVKRVVKHWCVQPPMRSTYISTVQCTYSTLDQSTYVMYRSKSYILPGSMHCLVLYCTGLDVLFDVCMYVLFL